MSIRRKLAVLLGAGIGLTALVAGSSAAQAGARTSYAPRVVMASEQHFKIAGVASKRAVGSGFQYHYSSNGNAYVNAWNGGPLVNVFNAEAVNNDFTVIQNPQSGFQMIKRTNGSGGNGCIGDRGNDPNIASTSLNSCGSPIGVGNGWGTDFVVGSGSPCPSGQWWFQNKHWSQPFDNRYLGPPNNFSNGDPFYLNKPAVYCFIRSAAD